VPSDEFVGSRVAVAPRTPVAPIGDYVRGFVAAKIAIEPTVSISGTSKKPDLAGLDRAKAAETSRIERESGSGGRTRTYDQAVNSRPLYH
jgi:hypothetical protein